MRTLRQCTGFKFLMVSRMMYLVDMNLFYRDFQGRGMPELNQKLTKQWLTIVSVWITSIADIKWKVWTSQYRLCHFIATNFKVVYSIFIDRQTQRRKKKAKRCTHLNLNMMQNPEINICFWFNLTLHPIKIVKQWTKWENRRCYVQSRLQ